MTKNITKRTIATVAIGATIVSNLANAGSFSLYTEGSAAAVGNYAAGVAAEAADASTGWYNPAGLAWLGKQQLIVSGVGVDPSIQSSGSSEFATVGFPSYTQTFQGLQAAQKAGVPALHYALPLGERAAFGFSVVSPFGLSTRYSYASPVRYSATLSKLMTIDVSPELAGKITDNLSIGAGIDFQWSRVKFNRMLGAPTLLQLGGLSPNLFDSSSNNTGDSFGVGFHAGLLGIFNTGHTRLGVNYQSVMKHRYHGNSVLIGRLADVNFENAASMFSHDGLYSNAIEFPQIITLSAYQDINPQWALLGSLVHTGWNVFNVIQLNQVAVFSPSVGQVLVNSTSLQDYKNTWRAALGTNYRLNEQLMLRAGLGHDATPTIDAERDIRLPDANRYALSIGGHYQVIPAVGFDLGYTYLFANKTTSVHKTDQLGPTSTYTIDAFAKPYAHLLGLQLVWTI